MKPLNTVLFLFIFFFLNTQVQAVTISQCQLADGTIEFTNKGCTKSTQLHSRRTFNKDLNNSQLVKVRKTKRKQKLFKQKSFVHLQNKLIKAKNLSEMEKHAQIITDTVKASAQQGQLDAAYDMVAATYVKISKYLKNKRWTGEPTADYMTKIRSLFEEILISQSTTSSAQEMTLIIQNAWKSYLLNT